MTASPPASDGPRAALRRRIREQRRALSEPRRRSARLRTKRRLGRLAAVRSATRLAVYLAVDGEPDLAAVVKDAQTRRKSVYAPVLDGDTLRFARLPAGADLRKNRFGILEPRGERRIDPRHLDVVLVPLVAFDESGTRLGMGGGYYDRCFHFLNTRSSWVRPKLIGIAYEFQRLQRIHRHSWDVPLWAAVTEKKTYRFHTGEKGR